MADPIDTDVMHGWAECDPCLNEAHSYCITAECGCRKALHGWDSVEAIIREVDRLQAENEGLHLVNGAADELIQSYKVMLERAALEAGR